MRGVMVINDFWKSCWQAAVPGIGLRRNACPGAVLCVALGHCLSHVSQGRFCSWPFSLQWDLVLAPLRKFIPFSAASKIIGLLFFTISALFWLIRERSVFCCHSLIRTHALMSLIAVVISPQTQERSPLSFIVQKKKGLSAEQPWVSYQMLIISCLSPRTGILLCLTFPVLGW